jgi:TIGR03009 family protein
MRGFGLSISGLLVAAGVAAAQTPTPMGLARPDQLPGAGRAGAAIVPAAAVALPPALQAHLSAWEKKSTSVGSYYSDCEYVRKNLLVRKETTFTGTMMCMKPNLARMRIDNKADRADFLSYIADGKAVYEYAGKDKVVRQFLIPAGGKGGVGDNLLMEFMSGSMSADDVKTRFDLKLEKEEEYYTHIKILPKLEKDKQEFESMLLVLYSGKLAERKWDYLPAVVVIQKNRDEIDQWTFKEPKINNDGIKKEHFVATMPRKEDGWEFKTMNAAPTGGANPTVPKTYRP